MAKTFRHKLSDRVHTTLQCLGFDFVRYDVCHAHPMQRARLLGEAGVTCVLDIGANEGQYASELRRSGYRGRIISFEPLTEPYRSLAAVSRRDPLWTCVNAAVGDRTESATINVAKNAVSSSMLPILDKHRDAAPDSVYVGTQTVSMLTLDTAVADLLNHRDVVWAKVDVQGFEKEVLASAFALSNIRAFEIELSVAPLYENQLLYLDLIHLLRDRGYHLVSVDPGFRDQRTGRMLQFDGIFLRDEPGTEIKLSLTN